MSPLTSITPGTAQMHCTAEECGYWPKGTSVWSEAGSRGSTCRSSGELCDSRVVRTSHTARKDFQIIIRPVLDPDTHTSLFADATHMIVLFFSALWRPHKALWDCTFCPCVHQNFRCLSPAVTTTSLVLAPSSLNTFGSTTRSFTRKHMHRILPLSVGVRMISTPLCHSCRHREESASSPIEASTLPRLLKASKGTPRSCARWMRLCTCMSFEFHTMIEGWLPASPVANICPAGCAAIPTTSSICAPWRNCCLPAPLLYTTASDAALYTMEPDALYSTLLRQS
mmetsp:Transcript_12764/g.28357  ORF Transcript_12764/g.28357 Transcript_12764/m.28357 type:complete len:283 (-) Transcript_12764:222-1070(-)